MSCKDDDELYPQLGSDPKNITEIAQETPELSSLLGALTQVGLDSTLRSTATYTVFAPNNSAFSGVDVSSLSDSILTNVLLNHVITTTTPDFASTLATGYISTMATGPEETNLSLYINADNSLNFNGVASPVEGMFDIGATNGIVHVVDNVLMPPTVVDHALANPDLASLAEAVVQAELAVTLSGAGPFTVFAPTNAAFEEFLTAVNGAFGWSTLSDIPVDVLTEVLLYHVISGENIVAEMTDETTQISMQGETFAIGGTEIDDASYENANIVATDIQGVNGVVHAIDKVLLPEGVFQSVLSATLDIPQRCEDRGFTTFLEAADKVGLTETLETETLTVFAPSNDGFEALFALTENFESIADFVTEEELQVLADIVNYHLVAGELMESDLVDGQEIESVYGDTFTVDLTGEFPRLRPSFEDAIPSGIVTSNIGATNGIIHEINRAMIPDALLSALGIDTGGCEGAHPVGDPDLVFFDWDDNGAWWGSVAAENEGSISLDGSSYGRANFTTGGGGWNDMYWRNDAGTFNGAATVGTNLEDYVLKFDINTLDTPIAAGIFKFRFHSDAVDAFYDFAPWSASGEALDTEGGWISIEIPLSELGQPDFSAVNQEFGMAFDDGGTAIALNFAIDNVRFDAPGYTCGGPDPVDDVDLVFFDWDDNGAWWGAVASEGEASISLDGSNYGRANLTTGGGGWNDMFWRNDASTFNGASTVGTNIDDYVLKFDINTLDTPISAGIFKFRFHSDAVDAFYDYAPWTASGEALDTEGSWITITIPLSELGQPDFGAVNQEFGMAFDDGGVAIMLNFAIDNVRFEAL
ncbi:hypothetical protein LPB138_13125 [Urechidicola croceus]|uniref:FAS1 domain-containing protein n=1 Tax=Urechidicola croceus TaxID=1850246 RepID=A0A1D8PAF1_9FLAO|nr:hypothetical protein LPB138_13125 [Urechidicola croceus]